MTVPSPSPERRPVPWLAPHADPALVEGRRERFLRTMRSSTGPHLLAHYRHGVCDFSVDVLAEASDPPVDAGLCREVAGQLSFMIGSLDGPLAEARTGRLMRVVLHGDRGVLYGCAVVPEEHVVGLLLDGSGTGPLSELRRVQEADLEISALAEDLRTELGLLGTNPGGWSGWLTAPPEQGRGTGPTDLSVPADPADPAQIRGLGPQELVRRCRNALDHRDLLYVAHVRDSRVTLEVDIFEDPRALGRWGVVPPAVRRAFYAGFCPRLESLAGQLGHMVGALAGDPLRRIVLDVEQGAIYYYRLGPGEYLVGVTPNQSRVPEADRRTAKLALAIAHQTG